LYCSAWINRGYLKNLSIEFVERYKLGTAVQANQEQITSEFTESHTTDAGLVAERRVHQVKTSRRGAHISGASADQTPAFSEIKKDAKTVLAIIDDKVAIDHLQFKNSDGNSRIGLCWDQTSNLAHGHSAQRKFGYTLLKQNNLFVDQKNKRKAYHGTHVAGLAGGLADPFSRLNSTGRPINNERLDAASEVDMAVVMLTKLAVADTSGGALGVSVLDALTFLIENSPNQAHLVVNLSFGHQAGPHNGTSILECAIEELIQIRKNFLTVVVPSGNSFDSQCHASYVLKARGVESIVWRVLPDDKTPSFLEIWMPQTAQCAVTVIDPHGVQVQTSKLSNSHNNWGNNGNVTGGVWRSENPANANDRQMILIALAPTRVGPGQSKSLSGDWIIRLENLSTTQKIQPLHAWVERDNSTFGDKPKGRQSYLVDNKNTRSTKNSLFSVSGVSGYGSMNAIATGSSVRVVGGYVFKSRRIASYSGAASIGGDVRAPDCVAPSDQSSLVKGILSCTNEATGRIRLSGTSAAAPLYTRKLINSISAALVRVIPLIPVHATAVYLDPSAGSGFLDS
jgi:hypothetical protein